MDGRHWLLIGLAVWVLAVSIIVAFLMGADVPDETDLK